MMNTQFPAFAQVKLKDMESGAETKLRKMTVRERGKAAL